GGTSATTTPVLPNPDENPATPRTRYSLNNKCYALKSNLNGKYVAASGTGYAANADKIEGSTPFFLKPSSLGSYLLYTRPAANNGQLVNAAAPVANVALDSAADTAIWTLKALGDHTAYPAAPQYNVEPDYATVIVPYRT